MQVDMRVMVGKTFRPFLCSGILLVSQKTDGKGRGMRIEFTIQTGCDFKDGTHSDDYELRFQAVDETNSEEYSRFFSTVRAGDGGIVDFLIAIFERAYEVYGLTSQTGWATEGIPDEHDDAPSVATLKRYQVGKLPRKRRYGFAALTASAEWDYPLPYDPICYRNPARNDSMYAITQVYFANDFSSANEYTKASIVEGYAIARTTEEFYKKMARVYEEKTGDKVDLNGRAA